MKICHFVFLLSISQSLFSLTEEQCAKRVHNHIIVRDYSSAVDEAALGLKKYPQSKMLWQSSIRALAKAGDDKAVLNQWKSYVSLFPDESSNRELLEALAWGLVNKGSDSSSPIIRVLSLLGAFFSQDAQGIPILQKGMRDENYFLRKAAVQLVSHMHDARLQDEILQMFKTERMWPVRLEVIKAMGQFKSPKLLAELEGVLNDDSAHFEEKTAAIQSLAPIFDHIDQERTYALIKSDRVGFRLLGCELLSFFEQKEHIDWIAPCFDDYHPAVRAQALQTLGILRIHEVLKCQTSTIALKLGNDPDPLVAVTAAWLLMQCETTQFEGDRLFERLLKAKDVDNRYLAAAALASTGKYGVKLAKKIFYEETDPYIKMNLALGLIGQRADIRAANDCLFAGLSNQKEKWAWREMGQFRVLAPSQVKHDDLIPNYPESVNQMTRLEILEILSFFKHPRAEEALKTLLQESNWGVCGLSAALLLTEGSEASADLVRQLLKDSNVKVRVQAALILSLWGEGEETLPILYAAYPAADRDLKGQILEGIGRIGSSSSLSFLVEKMQEPYQSLRIIAAAALLMCLANS